MAATSYSTLPSNIYIGLVSKADSYHSTAYGTYDSGVGSLTSHPYQYETSSYGGNLMDSQQPSLYSNDYHQSTHSNIGYSTQQQPYNTPTNKYVQQQQQLNDYSNPQTSKNKDRSQITNNNNNESHATTQTRQPLQKKNLDNQHIESKNHQQNSHAGTTQPRPLAPVDNQHHPSQSHLVRSERQISNPAPKQQHQKTQPPPQSNPNRSDQKSQQPPQSNSNRSDQKSQPPLQSNLNRSDQKSQPPAQSNLTRSDQKSQPPLQSNLNRSNQQISKSRASSPPVRPRSSSNSRKNQVSEAAHKTNNPSQELRLNKSSTIRAAAIKKKEETREQNRKNQFFPAGQNKATPTKLKSQQTSPQTDVEQSDIEKTQRKKKQSHSLPKTQKKSHSDGEQTDTGTTNRNKKKSHSQSKQRKSRFDGYQTEDNNNSSGDDDNHKHQRSKSQKRTTFSDSHLDKHSQLPLVRHSRMPPYRDPYLDYPLPSGHPLRGRFPYYDDYPPYGPYPGRYPHRHLHEEAGDIPPYLAPYHDPYDPFFDYQKRKAKPKRNGDETNSHNNHEDSHGGMNGYETERDDGAKSQISRKSKNKNANDDNGGRKSRRKYAESMHSHWPPGYYHPGHYHERDDMLEIWRQERNDYLKKKFKPTIHDVLYSQQWMKADSYLENQRRRALRDAQGYYFPYKKYTLKDYKDMQKLSTQNPFADSNEITIDRKERAKKRQEYGSLVERQMIDNPGIRQIPPRDMPPRRPWHLSGGEIHDPEAASKRERALEYAKEQIKYRPVNSTNDHSHRLDPTEQYTNDRFQEMNNGSDKSHHQRTNKNHQSYDDYA